MPAVSPTLIVLSGNDSPVGAVGTRGFVRQAEAAELDFALVHVTFTSHVFNQIAANSLSNQTGRTVRRRFLSEQVPLPCAMDGGFEVPHPRADATGQPQFRTG